MKVVVVENSVPTRKLLIQRLTSHHDIYIVAEAANEDAAVQAILALAPDLVTLDLGLDQGSGVGVLRRIRRAGFGGQVYIFSSEERGIMAPLCLALGANHYFQKLDDDDALFEAAHSLRHTLTQE